MKTFKIEVKTYTGEGCFEVHVSDINTALSKASEILMNVIDVKSVEVKEA